MSPYGRSSGLNLGEGAALLVLERLDRALERGATVLAELRGCGLSADAYHPTAPDPSGRGASLAMRRALRQAAVGPEAVDYVNGHGTGTQANDAMERNAFRSVFGARAPHVPVSSTKSMIGHTLGAAGAIEAAACVLSLDRGVVPPTVNLPVERDELFDFVPDHGREQDVHLVMSNNYAFGGSNASVVFARPGAPAPARPTPEVGVSITGVGVIGSLGATHQEWVSALGGGRSGIAPIAAFDASRFRCRQAAEGRKLPTRGFAAPNAWRKMDTFEKGCVASARMAWNDAGIEPTPEEAEGVAVIFATSNGSFETMTTFERGARISAGEANPSLFPHTAMNAPAGHVCSTLGLRGPTSTITAGGVSGLSALVYGVDLIRQGEASTCLIVAADQFCEAALEMFDPWDGVLTHDTVRPFDRRANGTALGEAAVTFVLERSDLASERGRRSYGRVLVALALASSDLDPGDLDYCAAAASGIAPVDAAEAVALSRLVGDTVAVGAPKSVTGECMAASGAINVVACLAAINDGVLTPSVGLDDPIPGSLRHVTGLARGDARHCLANSMSFGGNYVSVVIGAE